MPGSPSTPDTPQRAQPTTSTSNISVLTAALVETVEVAGAYGGSVYLLPAGSDVLRLTVLAGVPRDIARPWDRIGLSAKNPVADALRENRLIWVGSAQDMVHRYPSTAVTLPYDFAIAAVPLATAKTVYGALVALWPGSHPARISPREREGLLASATRLTARLEEASLSGNPVRPGPEPRVLVPPTAAGQPAEHTAAIQLATRLPEGLCALDTEGHIVYANPAAADLVGVPAARLVGHHPWMALPWLNDPAYEDRYRAAVLSQQPTSFVALRPPSHWLSFALYPDPVGVSIRITPARARSDAGPAVTAPDEAPTPMRAGALYHILHLASALTEAVSAGDVVELVADQILPAFGGEAWALFAVQGGRLHVVGHRGYPPATVAWFDRTSLASHTPGVRALVTGLPAFFESRHQLEQAYPLRASKNDGMAAWAFLPLIASGRPVGSCVLAFDHPHRFTIEERAVLSSLGGLIAQALERARLYDAKNQLAHGLQASLLPRAVPRIPGIAIAARYLPGTEGMDIGGDFYDLFPLDDRFLGAVIGDVQGHSVTAAALMGQIRTAVRAYAMLGQDPEHVLSRTNRLLTDLDPGLFASCTYLRLDRSLHTASLARAGHPQPLLRHPDGRVELLDVSGGLLLGIDAAADYPLTHISLPVGSTMALYTDGLIESTGTDLDRALVDLGTVLGDTGDLPLEDVADALTFGVRAVPHRTDDIALLLLRPEPA